MEIRLPPGAIARGTVVDAETGAPLKNAEIAYKPDRIRNENVADQALIGWQGRNLTNESGEFELVVPYGPGTMFVHGPTRDYVLKAVGQREVSGGQPGGVRLYAHAIATIDPVNGEELAPLKFEIRRGATVTGRVTDIEGKPVDRTLMISRLQYEPLGLQWRGATEPVRNGTFEIHGLEPGSEYPLHFVVPDRNLGATATVSADSKDPSVVLQPCGTAKARFIDQEGKPIAGLAFDLQIVVTPGKPKLARLPDQGPEFLADEDSYSKCIRMWSNGEAPISNAEGNAKFEWLIPGATYRLYRRGPRAPEVAAEFTVDASETRDLGEIQMQIGR
jgi:hypothetical protein